MRALDEDTIDCLSIATAKQLQIAKFYSFCKNLSAILLTVGYHFIMTCALFVRKESVGTHKIQIRAFNHFFKPQQLPTLTAQETGLSLRVEEEAKKP